MYKGGMSDSSGDEAHSAYAFYALGCLYIVGTPYNTITKSFPLPYT